ncbi:hypothetical protein [Sphingomonas mollis]|uniref:Uncharacterized protein n=1 Tax=Sphingomonas mollis TaxID=2795726 RepID=A0ABS0XUR1_9SPHN|nr:hypothetical protein [Sphingomonas sp. BT553]MBJ6123772.1 hypothetical protein [Sphingomonas sp. BT553]
MMGKGSIEREIIATKRLIDQLDREWARQALQRYLADLEAQLARHIQPPSAINI